MITFLNDHKHVLGYIFSENHNSEQYATPSEYNNFSVSSAQVM